MPNFYSNKEVSIGKIDESKMQVEVIVRVPDIADYDGDITTKEEIVDMAHSYPYWGNVDAYHSFNNIGNFVESYILKDDVTQNLPNGKTMVTPAGTWIAVLKVNDNAVWANIKNGIITGASLVAVPGRIPINETDSIPLRERKWEVDDVFRRSDQTFEEKMRAIDMIYSNKSAEINERGAGGGTTLNAIKSLGLGIEVIAISLVEAPNQSEAAVISVKSIGEIINEKFKTLKSDLLNFINKSTTSTIKEKGDEIMTIEELLEALKSDQSVIDAIKAILTPVVIEEVKPEVIEDVKTEVIEEVKTEVVDESAAMAEKIKELEAKIEEVIVAKSRVIDTEATQTTVVKSYERKRRNGVGSL